MSIARYTKLHGHPVWMYNVELIVYHRGKRTKIAEFNCRDDRELKFATECCDYVIGRDEA